MSMRKTDWAEIMELGNDATKKILKRIGTVINTH